MIHRLDGIVSRGAALFAGLAMLVNNGCAAAVKLNPSPNYNRNVKRMYKIDPSCPPITSGYGSTTTALGKDRTRGSHDGIDISVPSGTPVLAVAPGRVIHVGSNVLAGNILRLNHGTDPDENYFISNYAHLSSFASRDGQQIKEGDWIERGEVIGYVGNTGDTDGHDHLHHHTYASKELHNRIDSSGFIYGIVLRDPNGYWHPGSKVVSSPIPGKDYGDKPGHFSGATYPIKC